MKSTTAAIIVGMILLYFIDTAFKISIFEFELLIHSLLRFVAGFVLLGIGVFFTHKLTLKTAVYVVLALVLADDIFDYVRNVDSFKPEIMLHSIYMLLWGALLGYLVLKQYKISKTEA